MKKIRNMKKPVRAAVLILAVLVAAAACTYGYYRFTRRFDTGSGYNSYCMEKVWHACSMMDAAGDDSYLAQLEKIMSSAEYYFDDGSMTSIDDAAYICLLTLIGEDEEITEEKLEDFLERRTDPETGLLWEYDETDDLEEQVHFTVEIIELFDSAGIETDSGQFLDGFYSYYEETEFLSPDEAGDDDGYFCGGMALYALYLTDPSFDISGYSQWCLEWVSDYSDFEIESWDEYFEYQYSTEIFYKLLGTEDVYQAVLEEYRTKDNITQYFDEEFDLSAAYIYFSDYIGTFDEETLSIFTDILAQELDYYFDRLKS